MAFKFSSSAYQCAMKAEEYRNRAHRDYLNAQNAYNDGNYSMCSSFAMLVCNGVEMSKLMQRNAENAEIRPATLRNETSFKNTKQDADEYLKLADEAIQGIENGRL